LADNLLKCSVKKESKMNLLVLALNFCLAQSSAATQPIIGGQVVGANDFISHSVVALVSTSATSQALCTASIVANDLAITAAHCAKDQARAPQAQMDLIFNNNIRAANPVVRVVDRVEIPTEWNPASDGNDTSDVALLHFGGGLPAGYVVSDLLPFNQVLTVGESVVLAGYGITDANADTGEGILRKTLVSIANPNYSPSEVELDQSHGGGACHGDSGGPAYVMIQNHPYLFGITSRGGGACDEDVIYTEISAYADWFTAAVARIRSP
jgi:secreted trypsin-like serine protease